MAEPPAYRYPLEDNEEWNTKTENESLADIEAKIIQWREEKGSEVAAVVIEPILSAGGDHQISAAYANKLRKMTKEMGVYLIIDEVHTGVAATGKFWAHEHWDLESPPDFVTFSKKFQASGFFYGDELKQQIPFRQFNTWMGDPVRTLIAAK